ncbi:MAG: hypothetical protein H7Y43_04410 [Akkermansiaceae bacterium]|nr:hypothetical protein [Verrucomicrobiales bacterium]
MSSSRTPVKKRIIARVLDVCQQIKEEGIVRLAVRKQGLFLSESVDPALHVVTGDESVISEDSHGYNCKFPVAFQFIFKEARDPYGMGDDFEAAIQGKIEADDQLLLEDGTGLCSKITYEGSTPVISEEAKPSCLTIVMYQIEYRRRKARPDLGY